MSIRRTLLVPVALVAAVTGVVPAASAVGPPERTYEVTIENLTDGQWLTPAAVATHRRATDVFEVGSAASFEVKEVAENGNLDPLIGAWEADRHVADIVVAAADDGPPPIAPGGSVIFEVTARPDAKVLSWVSMLICTNDGFTGLDSVMLPRAVGASVSLVTGAYDAGTEVNTEAWDDLVPPCAQLTGFGDQGGSGMSDPALAEGGVIHGHAGITGAGDLVAEVHGWTGPVAAVTITRID